MEHARIQSWLRNLVLATACLAAAGAMVTPALGATCGGTESVRLWQSDTEETVEDEEEEEESDEAPSTPTTTTTTTQEEPDC